MKDKEKYDSVEGLNKTSNAPQEYATDCYERHTGICTSVHYIVLCYHYTSAVELGKPVNHVSQHFTTLFGAWYGE